MKFIYLLLIAVGMLCLVSCRKEDDMPAVSGPQTAQPAYPILMAQKNDHRPRIIIKTVDVLGDPVQGARVHVSDSTFSYQNVTNADGVDTVIIPYLGAFSITESKYGYTSNYLSVVTVDSIYFQTDTLHEEQ